MLTVWHTLYIQRYYYYLPQAAPIHSKSVYASFSTILLPLHYTEANNTIQSIHHSGGGVSLLKTPGSADVTALETELGELRERVADLQSDKVLMEEELREALAGQHQQHEKSTKVCHQNIRYGMSLLKYVTKYLQLWYVISVSELTSAQTLSRME
mgnify:CR=1 FL=1